MNIAEICVFAFHFAERSRIGINFVRIQIFHIGFGELCLITVNIAEICVFAFHFISSQPAFNFRTSFIDIQAIPAIVQLNAVFRHKNIIFARLNGEIFRLSIEVSINICSAVNRHIIFKDSISGYARPFPGNFQASTSHLCLQHAINNGRMGIVRFYPVIT